MLSRSTILLLTVLTLAASRQGQAATTEAALQQRIRGAEASVSMRDLTAIVRDASACCAQSPAIAAALTGWLRESHPIYAGRLPSEVSQFRGFLLASLAAFPPNDELYGYVKSEFLFGGHAFGIAAAAAAARNFPDRSAELLPLMEPFLGSAYEDEAVDITTPELNYPLVHPTRSRYEIVRTITAFGPRAWRSLPMLDAIAACRNCGLWNNDAALQAQAAEAAAYLRKVTPPCCRKPATTTVVSRGLQLIDRKDRRHVAAPALKLLDQDGNALRFADLRGPFVLTFFYSQCTNQQKCVMTVRRLQTLASECAKENLGDRVGIYGMTYDPRFDSPSILRQYGKLQGLRYTRNVRLLKTDRDLGSDFLDQLALRVSYGAGSVNQHGVQVFVFDKHARLAATLDNELWSPTDVKNCLVRLMAE